MSGLRILAVLGTLVTGPAFAAAMPEDPIELVRGFATCAGRYSAEYEGGQLLTGIDIDESEALRDAFVELVEAVLPDADLGPNPAAIAMSWRIEAKVAHGALLARATYQSTSPHADLALQAASRHMEQCSRLLLGA